MKKYVIALDLDDTVLNTNKEITDLTKKYLQQLSNDGHKVVLSTGRPLRAMKQYYDYLELDTPIISDNGGFTHHPFDNNFNEVRLGIDKQIIIDVTKNTKDCINSCFFSIDNTIYIDKQSEKFDGVIHINDQSTVIKGNLYDICDVNPYGMLFLLNSNKINEFEEYVLSRYSDTISLRMFFNDGEEAMYELYQKSISKREGLEVVLDYYGLTTNELIAMGDGDNDIEMIELASVGVAMKNGRESVIKAANHTTEYDCDNDGVVRFLDKFLENNKL